MLKPSMNELMAKVSNRYLLVNLAAQRARDLSEEAEQTGEKLPDKSVKLALDEIADGSVVYRDGPRPEPVPQDEPAVPAAQEAADLGRPVQGQEEDSAFALAPDIIYSGRPSLEEVQEF